MRLPDPQQRGFALPLALTTSALLLLSSLSLQTLALHARQRSQLFTPAGLGHCPREVSDEL